MKAPSTKILCRSILTIVYLMGIIGIVASGGGGGGGDDNGSGNGEVAPEIAATPAISFEIKTFRFTWADVPDATHYRLFENPDGLSGFNSISGDIPQGTQSFDHIVPLYEVFNASYILQSCNQYGCSDSSSIFIGNPRFAIGYFKASNTEADDLFGTSVSLSGDGNTLAVGASGEDSNATGINGIQANNTVSFAGAVYVFTRSGATWAQQAYIKASNTDADDSFGRSISLSDDGNTLVVGADGEDSNSIGINGNEADNSASGSGAVYVFTRSGATWAQQAYIKASNTGVNDYFGARVSLSGDGNTLAVVAISEASNATGIDGNQADNSANDSGAVYIFTRSGTTWAQQAYIKASNTEAGDFFGWHISLSDDGNTLAAVAISEDSNATGIDGNQADNSASISGAAYIFNRSGATWSQQAYVKASNTEAGDRFGMSVSLSDDGNTLAVGASWEDSNAIGIDGNQFDNSVSQSGAAYVFTRSGAIWAQQSYFKASNTESDDRFGATIGLSGDGNTLAVGAFREDSSVSGIDRFQANAAADNSADNAGAVYIFTRSGATWSQQAYVKASNVDSFDNFGPEGDGVSLSDDGNTLAVGALQEDSNATGVDGNQASNSASDSGAVYLY